MSCPIYALSTEHSDLPVKVIGCMPVNVHEMIEDMEVESDLDKEEITQLLHTTPAVKSAMVVSTEGQTTTHRIVSPLCPVISTFQSLGMLPSFPLHIKDGKETVLVITTPQMVRDFIAMLKEKFEGVEVTAITHDFSNTPEDMLTPRQAEVFKMAVSSGFWDIPRRTTLGDMASMLGIAKSTIHETIAIIENKLIHDESQKLFT
jgi:predicted DNA binding protein